MNAALFSFKFIGIRAEPTCKLNQLSVFFSFSKFYQHILFSNSKRYSCYFIVVVLLSIYLYLIDLYSDSNLKKFQVLV